MDINPSSPVDRKLPVGHHDGRDFPMMGFVSKTLIQAFEDLKRALSIFLAQHPEWYYGTIDTAIFVWRIGNQWSYTTSNGTYFPPSLNISFWKKGPTAVFKGKKLTARELDIPAQFMAQCLEAHPHLVCKSKIDEKWAITYRVSAKASKRRKKTFITTA